MIIEPLTQPVEPADHRLRVEDHAVAIGQPHRRYRVMHRILERPAQRGGEFAAPRHCPDHLGNVPVAALERRRHPVDQPGRRRVAHEVGRKLHRHVACGGGRGGDEVERLLDLAETRTLYGMAEEMLVAEIVARGIELE